MQVAWLLAVPPSYGIDEFDHAYRASSVAAGEWLPGTEEAENGRGVLIRADPSIVRESFRACDDLDYPGPDNCTAITRPGEDGLVVVASAAGTYNPAWYFMAGTAAKPFEGQTAILAMRVASLVMCDLLLLMAAVLIARHSTSPLPLLALATVSAPVVLYATAVAAPNGVQYSAGILMWVALLRVLQFRHDLLPHKSLWSLLALSASVVATVHTTGPLWVVLTALTTFPLTRGILRRAWSEQRSALTFATITVLASCAASVIWVVLAGTNDPGAEHDSFGPSPRHLIAQGPLLWFFQSLATLRFRSEAAPVLAYAALAPVMLTLVGLGIRRAGRDVRLVLAMMAIASGLVPLALTFLTYDQLGSAWQGRYALPLTVGITLLAATQLNVKATIHGGVTWFGAGLLGIGHTVTLAAMFAEPIPGAIAPPGWSLWILGTFFVGTMGTALAISANNFSQSISARESNPPVVSGQK